MVCKPSGFVVISSYAIRGNVAVLRISRPIIFMTIIAFSNLARGVVSSLSVNNLANAFANLFVGFLPIKRRLTRFDVFFPS